jgi:predicted HTH domain antitoxin
MAYSGFMAELTVQYPDDLLLASGKTRSAVEDQLRFELAVRLFQVGQLSLGKAAELAGLSKTRFGDELGRLKIPTINHDDSEIEAELSALRGSHHRG